MRLIIITLVALNVALSAFALPASDRDMPVVTWEKVGEKKFQLKYMAVPEGKVMVSIKNEDHKVVYKDIIETEKLFYRNYDLHRLEAGKYHIEVFSTVLGKLQDFDINLYPEKKAPAYFAKVKVLDEKSIAVLVTNLEAEEKTLRIYDNNNLLFEEPIAAGNFGKRFTFKNIPSLDKITVEISDGKGASKYLSAL